MAKLLSENAGTLREGRAIEIFANGRFIMEQTETRENKKWSFERLRTDNKFAKNVFKISFTIILILPWLLFAAISIINVILQGSFDYFNLGTDGVSTWFSFWGGYVGVIITYLLTVCTIRLTFISENQAERDTLDQLAFQLDQLEIEKVCLYNLEKQYPVNELQSFEANEGNKFLIKIVFKNSFPSYFRLANEKRIVFGKEIQDNCQGISVPSCHTNGDHLEILLLIPEKEKVVREIEEFYFINYYEQSVKSVKEREKYLKIICQFENTLYDNKKDGFLYKVSMDIKLKNVDDYKKEWIELTVLDRIISGKREKKSKNEKD